ncbi:MAG: DNA-binding response OmpR family regulator [Verrucomicrobiales bacterium]|jgi:DNA-binding response OmpR family regulator
MRLLVVEVEPDLLRSLTGVLREEGYAVDETVDEHQQQTYSQSRTGTSAQATAMAHMPSCRPGKPIVSLVVALTPT